MQLIIFSSSYNILTFFISCFSLVAKANEATNDPTKLAVFMAINPIYITKRWGSVSRLTPS